MINVERPMISQ